MGPLRGDAADPSVEARDLSYRYPGGRPALSGVDLDVHPGQIVAVVGPNGSGKTTLLRLVAGRLAPSGGRLRVRGADPPLPPPILRRIGFADADPVHREALTGRENARFFARAAGLAGPDAEDAVDPLLSRLELDAVADTPVEEYSRGMKRKLLLAEALAHRPEILLFDEPFGGLDPPGAAVLEALLRDRAKAGAAVLLATHALVRVPGLADRVVLLHRGRVVADAPPEALLERHRPRAEAELQVRTSDGGPVPTPGSPFRVEPSSSGTDEPGPDGERHLRISWPREAPGVPELVVRLAEAGVEIRELRVREPGLGRVFRELTGAELDE